MTVYWLNLGEFGSQNFEFTMDTPGHQNSESLTDLSVYVMTTKLLTGDRVSSIGRQCCRKGRVKISLIQHTSARSSFTSVAK